MEQPLQESQFKDKILRTYCINPILNSEVDNNKNEFCFHYSYSVKSLAQIVRLMLLVETGNDKNIISVTTMDFNCEIFEEDNFDNFAFLLKSCQD